MRGARANAHTRAGRRVLQRVADEIFEHTIERIAIGVDVRQGAVHVQLHAMRGARAPKQLDGGRDQRRGIDDGATQRRRQPALEAREIQEIADDATETLDLAAHDIGQTPDFVGRKAPRGE